MYKMAPKCYKMPHNEWHKMPSNCHKMALNKLVSFSNFSGLIFKSHLNLECKQFKMFSIIAHDAHDDSAKCHTVPKNSITNSVTLD